MDGKRRSAGAVVVFFAFTTPLGIAAHLLSELAGLGWHADSDVILSSRHAYLALIAMIVGGSLLLAVRGVPKRERGSRIAELIESLPFHSRGPAFTLASFVAQFAFFAVTQIGEGCPLCGGDVVVGIFAAAIAALVGAFAVALGKRRILELVLALCFAFVFPRTAASGPMRAARGIGRLRTSRRRTPFAFRYRPPPDSSLLERPSA